LLSSGNVCDIGDDENRKNLTLKSVWAKHFCEPIEKEIMPAYIIEVGEHNEPVQVILGWKIT
jgi:hypothetical protein